MEVTLKITCLALLVIDFVQSGVLPVDKCTLTDKTCMISAVQKMLPIFAAGMPEYDIPPGDPMAMDDTKYDLSGLQFSLSNATLKGLKNSVIDDVDWDVKKKVFSIKFHTDSSIKGRYTAGGRVLILPITGDGQMKLKLKNIHFKLVVRYDTEKKNDKEYFKLTKYSVDFDIKDNAHYSLSNLFNGNKQLSDAMLTFLNENWQQISAEFGKPILDVIAKRLYKSVGNMFDKLPIDEIANV